MKKSTVLLLIASIVAICSGNVIAETLGTCPANGELKIFILSGQSNMIGFGQLTGSPGTMETYVESNPEDYGHLVDNDGKNVVRDDVWIVNLSYADNEQQGWLTTGYGASAEHIGPEYAFGFAVGDYYEDPVLIIKSGWGGRSLQTNFLSPSSQDYPTPQADGDTGFQYAEILRHVEEITGDLEKYYPDYSGEGYEVVGFGWHQGWNDRINQAAVDVYEKNMENFIKDIRKDLAIENLPFVIANTGMGGWDIVGSYKAKVEKHMAAQLAVADPEKHPEFEGNVAGVETRDFWRDRDESPSGQDYHWYRNWETLYLIGKGMGDSMVALLSCDEPANTTEGSIPVVSGQVIAFLGDSITAAGARPGGYCQLVLDGLQSEGIEVSGIFAGISGHKSNQMLARLEKDVLSKEPDWMTLSCGVNDVWHGERGVNLEDYKINITAIVDQAQAAGIQVMLLTSTMINEDQENDLNQKLLPYNAFLQELAVSKGCLIADLNAEMQEALQTFPEDAPKGKQLTSDGVHMNPQGNQMMALGILQAFGVSETKLPALVEGWETP
jgi:lysophospholipase L1-like esterase